jgi:hypothetical protein
MHACYIPIRSGINILPEDTDMYLLTQRGPAMREDRDTRLVDNKPGDPVFRCTYVGGGGLRDRTKLATVEQAVANEVSVLAGIYDVASCPCNYALPPSEPYVLGFDTQLNISS